MKNKKKKFRQITVILTVICLLFGIFVSNTHSATENKNRFNVMIVLDASGSMKNTDPDNLRFEAIGQFTNLLAERGNYLGGVVFSTKVSALRQPQEINGQKDKEEVLNALNSIAVSGWTNTGEALLSAISTLKEKGNPDLPSVIVFLSDGNTEMGTEKETKEALVKKADAIQEARENQIPIYSVCLNADKTADVTEMQQISDATGGVFREVGTAKDLTEVFNTFYNLIYGTSTISLVDDVFSSEGVVEKVFEVPGFGVEEVNIILYGKTSALDLYRPNGEKSSAKPVSLHSLTMLKITDIEAGKWKIVAQGIPGDKIKINMVYNSNWSVDIRFADSHKTSFVGEKTLVQVRLLDGNGNAVESSKYQGYSAELEVLNSYDEIIDKLPMHLQGESLEASTELEKGVYRFKAKVTGNYMEKESDILGPLQVLEPLQKENPKEPNQAPMPVENPVKKVIYKWPFQKVDFTFDMTNMATDSDEDEITYKIISASFLEGKDFEIEGNLIKMEHFSLSKGSFAIRAVDSEGLSCDMELVVVVRDVGIMALIGLAIGGLIALAVLGILLWIALTKPFRGKITAQSYCNHQMQGSEKSKRRGRMYLSVFGMAPTGLDYRKSYFQATGQNFIYLITDKPVIWNGQSTTKVRIQSDVEVSVTVNEKENKRIFIRYHSRIKTIARRPRR